MRLNLGCGELPAPHPWRNVDYQAPHTVDEVVDLCGPLPWPRDSVTHVYMGHVLEHLTVEDATSLLRRLLPLMAPGGQVMVVGPDVERGQAQHQSGEIDDGLWRVMRAGAGAQRWDGDRHLWDCEPRMLERILCEAGWSDVREVPIDEVPGFWPVVSRVTWQCAVGAVRGDRDVPSVGADARTADAQPAGPYRSDGA